VTPSRADILEPGRRLRCDCGGTLLLQTMPARPDHELRLVECSQCDYRRLWELFRGNDNPPTVSAVDLAPVTPQRDAGMCVPRDRRPPQCLVKSCQKLATEGGLCTPHHAMWHRAGRPGNQQAWAAAYTTDHRTVAIRPQPAGALLDETTPPAQPQQSEPAADGPAQPEQEQPMATKWVWEHGTRAQYCQWYRCGKPPVMAWIAAGRPTPRQWKRLQQGKPMTAATGRKRQEAQAPAAKPRPAEPTPKPATMPGPGWLDTIDLPEGTRQISDGTLGNYLTLATGDGRVLKQLPLVGVN
jgi:hypothetical protein